MEMLEKLRIASNERHQKKILAVEIQKQFEQINKLQQEKERLLYSLEVLNQGHPATDLLPTDVQVPEIVASCKTLATLKRKLSSYRLLGPCGLTVLEVSSKALVVSLTSVWKNLTQNFLLHIVDDKGSIKVVSTTVPYFIDVSSMLTSTEVTAWPKVMEDIGFLLNAYTQRRREVEHLQSEYKDVVQQISWNEPVAVVEISLKVKNTSGLRPAILRLDMCLVYNMEAMHPKKTRMESSHMLPTEEVGNIRSFFMTQTLSEAVEMAVDKLSTLHLEEEERSASGDDGHDVDSDEDADVD